MWRSERAAFVTPVMVLATITPVLAVLSWSAAGRSTLPGDVWVTRLVQSFVPHDLAGILDAVNALGGTLGAVVATLAATSLLAVAGRLQLAVLVLLTLPLRLVNALLKVLLESPRPQDGIVRVAEQQDSFGFPSGHVMGAALLYGALLIVIPLALKPGKLRNLAYGCAGAVLLLMGVSRIYVGAHWPSDVAGGYLWGIVFLTGLVGVWRLVTARIERRVGPAPLPADFQTEPMASLASGD
jgi:undecaprenyl-diphosphatase